MKFREIVVAALAMLLLFSSGTFAADKVRMQLNWVPEPEFGGIYAAQQSGAFAKHGLDVSITPGGAGTATWQMVDHGDAEFAVASADEVFIARTAKNHADVVAIFATYQTCPQGLMVHADRRVGDIGQIFTSGKVSTVLMEPGLPYVTFLQNKYGFAKVTISQYDGGLAGFLNDPGTAQQCFITSEPIAAKAKGSDPKVFLIADAGYNPYTAVVITRGQYAKDHPQQVQAMVQALQEGWRAYLDNPKAANDAMHALNSEMAPDAFAAAADAQKPLIETDETKKSGLGTMTVERWETLGKQMVQLKVIEQAAPANQCFIPLGK